MAKARALNDRTLKALKPKPGQRYEVKDAVTPGLVVRVTDKGTKTFALVHRYPGSPHPSRRAIGTYGAIGLAEARSEARRWLALIEKGIDPRHELERQRIAEQRKQADTFGAVFESLCATKLKDQRRGHVVERIIRKELLPYWHARPVADISRRDVREVIERIVRRGATAFAHNVLDAANAVFRFAVARDIIEHNPCKELSRRELIGAKRQRERTLTDIELFALWRASGRLGYPFGPAYRLLLLTGVRLEEAAAARRPEFDLHSKIWTIPAARFKTGATHVVPLSDAACAVLASLPHFNTGDHLFSASFGKTPVNGFGWAKARLDRRMLLTLRALARKRGDNNARSVELGGWVNHDLRRSLRSRLSALKIQDHVAELVIGHSRKGIAGVYDRHKYEAEKREALDKWAAYLRGIVEPSPDPDNVVQLEKARVS
jgi:integrase